MTVVEATTDPGAVDADHVDDAAGFGPLRRLVNQLLEDPRMAAAPGVAQAEGGDGVVPGRIIAPPVRGPAGYGAPGPDLPGRARSEGRRVGDECGSALEY